MQTEEVHISEISAGDTVIHLDEVRTVCQNNIGKNLCGKTIFGDSYSAGRCTVTRVVFPQWYKNKRVD